MLGTDVEIYLDGGERTSGQSSTIVDLSGDVPRIVRRGPISAEELREIVPEPQRDAVLKISPCECFLVPSPEPVCLSFLSRSPSLD